MDWAPDEVEFGNVLIEWIGAHCDEVSQAQTIIDDLEAVFVEKVVGAVQGRYLPVIIIQVNPDFQTPLCSTFNQLVIFFGVRQMHK